MATSAADPQGQEGHSLTRAGEDYLESIYRLSLESAEGDKSVRSVDVAEQLEVSKASVNKALSQLKEMGMDKMVSYYLDAYDYYKSTNK